MACLTVNSQDFSEKLKAFSFHCNNCKSDKVTVEIDWAAYPSDSWLYIDVICNNCKHEESLSELI